MKKFTVILVCLMAIMSTASIKAQDGNLSQGQWNHGLAIGAQWIATDLGFGKSESEVIQKTKNENYSLDDLRAAYGSKAKWVEYYDKLKKHEGETGNVDKLVSTIMGEYNKEFIRSRVRKDIEKYNSTHTGNEAQPAETTANETNDNGQSGVAQPSTEPSDNGTVADTKSKDDKGGKSHGGHGFLYFLSLVGLALGGIGAFLAMQARKENQAIMNDANDDIKNLQKQIDKMRATLKGQTEDSRKSFTSKRENKVDAKSSNDTLATAKKIDFDTKPVDKNATKPAEKKVEPQKEEEKKTEPKKEEPAAFGEPRILFMAKPDENDNFSRSASAYEPGNSIFELTTLNGKSGSFTVINKSEAQKLALLMPGETLARACSGNNIQSSAGKSKIITDRAGRAQLENGKWHIIVKAIIHYA